MRRRLAGQAFTNGVLIKSDKSWALATDGGGLKFGSVSSWFDDHPFLRLPLIRAVAGFFESVIFSWRIQRGLGLNRRDLIRPLLIYLALTVPVGLWLDKPVGFRVFSFVAAFVVFGRALPRSLWAYHGGEHKAVNAYEQGVDLDDLEAVAACSRVHNRCGTNLVTFLAAASMVRLPSVAPAAMAGTIGYTLAVIALSIELFRLVVRAPHLFLSRLALAPGRWLQRRVTTREPDRAQLALAVKAVRAVLVLDRIKAGVDS